MADERLDPHTEADDDVVARHYNRYSTICGAAEKVMESKPGRVLDFGCGTGYGSAIVRGVWPNASIIGVDRDPAAVVTARGRHGDMAAFYTRDAERSKGWMQREHRGTDLLLMVEVLEHLPAMLQQRFLTEAHQCFKWVAIAVPLGSGPSDANEHHLHEPSADEMRVLLRRGGWKLREFWSEEYESTSGPAVQSFWIASSRTRV